MKQAANEAFNNSIHHHNTMKKTIVKAFENNRESCVKETVHILPEFKLRRILLAVYFVNTNLPLD